MDIAKIRKKIQAQEKEKKAGETPAGKLAEPVAEEKTRSEETVEVHEELPQQKPEAPQQETGGQEKETIRVDAGDEDTIELLTFSLSNEEFAFRVPDVEEIVRFQKITKVPTMPDYVLGITSLRGKIIPVFDLKIRLGIAGHTATGYESSEELSEMAESGTQEKIMIISGPKGLVGAVIDRVIGVVRVRQQELLDPPAHLTEAEMRFIEGVVIYDKRFISIVHSDDTLFIETG